MIDATGKATRYPKTGDEREDEQLGIIGTLMNKNRQAILNHFPLRLAETLTLIAPKAGSFSNYHVTDKVNGSKSGNAIPFQLKPAQQFLSKLGVKENFDPLSTTANGNPLDLKGNPRVTVGSFDPQIKSELTLTGARVDRLINSAKIYINNDIFPTDVFKNVVGTLKPQTQANVGSEYLQDMAVGVCHVQEVDLLVEPTLDVKGKALLKPKSGIVHVDDPALILLSSPALNFDYGTARNMYDDLDKQRKYIEGMYRNLFKACLSEGRNYIAMPAAGLGAFGGKPEMYFDCLMSVAKEFPDLNIIYNPKSANAALFDSFLEKYGLNNIVRTEKDVLMVANELTKEGKLCGYHNASDSDVVLGTYDVGEYWKKGHYVAEEHNGAMTTAPLNSYKLNPSAYQNVIANNFSLEAESTINKSKLFKANLQDVKTEVAAQGGERFSPEQINAIKSQIHRLEEEHDHQLFANKERKRELIGALMDLLDFSKKMSPSEAVKKLRSLYKGLLEKSDRTIKLLNSIEDSEVQTKSFKRLSM